MLQSTKTFFSSALVFSALVISSHTHAALLIDNFTDFQTVTDTGTPGSTSSASLSLSAAASSLTGVQRTLVSDATGGGFGNQEILIGEPGGPGTGGLLAISNNTFSTGTATITWSGFTTTNFTTVANAILLEVLAIDLNVNVEMIVNGASTYTLSNLGSGNIFANFSSFSNPSAFNAVNQFQLKFTGPQAWDGQFRLLATEKPFSETPEPVTLFLIGLGFLSLSLVRKRLVLQ